MGSKHLDQGALAELKEVMDDEFSVLIETYISDSRSRIDHLKAAYDKGDADLYGKTAHSIKGSSNNIGAIQLGELCLQAETMGKHGDLSTAKKNLEEIEREFQQVSELLAAQI